MTDSGDTTDRGYPDDHPELRGHLLAIMQEGTRSDYVSREIWEKTAAERDHFRRTLAFISALRVSAGICDPQLDALLEDVGEDYRSAAAMARLVADLRADPGLHV